MFWEFKYRRYRRMGTQLTVLMLVIGNTLCNSEHALQQHIGDPRAFPPGFLS